MPATNRILQRVVAGILEICRGSTTRQDTKRRSIVPQNVLQTRYAAAARRRARHGFHLARLVACVGTHQERGATSMTDPGPPRLSQLQSSRAAWLFWMLVLLCVLIWTCRLSPPTDHASMASQPNCSLSDGDPSDSEQSDPRAACRRTALARTTYQQTPSARTAVSRTAVSRTTLPRTTLSRTTRAARTETWWAPA
jgi:hypothetical protein